MKDKMDIWIGLIILIIIGLFSGMIWFVLFGFVMFIKFLILLVKIVIWIPVKVVTIIINR